MKVEKISQKKISELVEEQIEKSIRAGEYQHGEKLPSVRELCDLFDVGRSAVRDAITSLKGKGLVEIRHGEGTYICPFDPAKLLQHYMYLPNLKDMDALFQVREILEAGIVQLAAEHRTEEDIEAMKLAIKEMKTMKYDENGLSDYKFHIAIAKAARNHILCQLMDFISSTIKKSMIEFHGYIASEAWLVEEIIHQHERIFEKIQAGEGERSGKEMVAHLEFVKKLMREYSQSEVMDG